MPSLWNPVSGAPIEGAGSIYNSSFVQAVRYFSPFAGANYPVFPSSSPFYAFSAETGYGGGDASLSSLSNAGYGGSGYGYYPSGSDITGSFAPTNAFATFPSFPASPGFGDIGGTILGRTMAGDVLTSYPTAWEMFALGTLGVPPLAATAIGGAAYAESRGYPGTVWTGFQGHAFGAFQWLNAGHQPGGRQDNLFDWADEMGLSPESFEAQSTFVLNEFGTVFAGNSRLFDLYNPLHSQATYAADFVTQFLAAGPAGNARDIGIAKAWPNYRTGVTPTTGPLFSLVPLPDFSE